jgi:anti-sigma B factor antagonist
MEIDAVRYKNCDVIKPGGRIDSDSSPALRQALEAVTNEKRYNIVCDLSEVEFLSSSGVWVLLDTQKECKKRNRGQLVLASANEDIQKTLELAGLQHFFQVYENVTDAVGNI